MVASSTGFTTPSLYVASNGNVGVGTGAPEQRLDVAGKLAVGGVKSNLNFLGLFVEEGVTAESTTAITSNASKGRALAVQGNGAAYFLGRDVSNNVEFMFGTSVISPYPAFLGSTTNHPLRFDTNNSGKMQLSATGGLSLGSSYLSTDPGEGSMIISGNLGIATTTPYAKLSVVSDTAEIPKFMVASSTGFTTPSLYVASNGNVGVGTNNPSAKLNIRDGDLRLSRSESDVNYYFDLDLNYDSSDSLNFNWSGNPFMQYNNSDSILILGHSAGKVVAPFGNFGVGTTTPYAKLSVVSDTAEMPKFMVASSTGFTTPALYVASNGNVGVGTASPLQMLQVGTTLYVDNANKRVGIGTASPDVNLKIQATGSNDADIGFASADSSGDFMAYHSSSGYLALPGDSVGLLSNSSASNGVFLSAASGGIRFVTNSHNTVSMYLNNSGNLGIANTNPQYKLDVSGSLNLNSTSTAYLQGHAVIGSSILQNGYGLTVATSTYFTSGITYAGDINYSGKLLVATSSAFGLTDAWGYGATLATSTIITGTTTIGMNNTLVVNTNNGRVGIGTGNPDNKLDILATEAYDGIEIKNTAEDGYIKIQAYAFDPDSCELRNPPTHIFLT